MDNLRDLLVQRKREEPPEVQIIRDFVRERFDEPVTVSVHERELIVTVASASLAGALRARLPELMQRCATTKRIVLRIGSLRRSS